MKSGIICAICEKPKKYSESYAVKIEDCRMNESILPVVRKVRVCRTCIKKMGYKVKKGLKNVGQETKRGLQA